MQMHSAIARWYFFKENLYENKCFFSNFKFNILIDDPILGTKQKNFFFITTFFATFCDFCQM